MNIKEVHFWTEKGDYSGNPNWVGEDSYKVGEKVYSKLITQITWGDDALNLYSESHLVVSIPLHNVSRIVWDNE